MNCFACHGGKILGKTHPGLPNSHYALATLTADVRKLKLMISKPLSRMDVGSMFVPLGTNNGTTNAVMFGVALMALPRCRAQLPCRSLTATDDSPRHGCSALVAVQAKVSHLH